jgi:Nucleoside 2-deoxyribosyltransferase
VNKLSILCLLVAISLQACVSTPHQSLPSYSVYLAGPEVFLPEPVQAGADKKATIARLQAEHNWPFKLEGLYPLDNAIENFGHNFETGMRIYHANIELMDRADFVAANMVRFRGPSMDVGTAFEMGYMRGLNKAVFAYYDATPFYGQPESPGLYKERVVLHYPVTAEQAGNDIHGQSIEDFGMADNLMMIGALESGNQNIAADFESVILQIAEHVQSNQKSQKQSREQAK